MKIWRKSMYLSLVGVSLLCFPIKSNAYDLMSNKVSHPKNAYYWIEKEFSNYGLKSEIERGVTAWNSLPEIQFTKEVTAVGGADVKMEYVNSLYGDSYAIHRPQGNITFYKNWRTDLSSIKRKETAVHEVGHALGLDHTQSKNNSISVMRKLDFNNKDYPLSDDIAGIKAKY